MPDDPLKGKDPRNGHFAPGNRFWEARTTFGPHPKFETPEALWDACVEYFEWNEANPLMESKLVSFQGVSTVEVLPKMRAMTVSGLCCFLGMQRSTWYGWRKNRADLADVIERVEDIIWRHKFEGAAADMLNGSLIARELGLADKQDHTTNGKDMNAKADLSSLSDAALSELVAARDAANKD